MNIFTKYKKQDFSKSSSSGANMKDHQLLNKISMKFLYQSIINFWIISKR